MHLGKSVASSELRLVVVYVNISKATFEFLLTKLVAENVLTFSATEPI